MSDKLLPRPFCGGAPNEKPEDNDVGVFWIICDNVKDGCGCEGPYKHSVEDAVAAWNRRSTSTLEAELQKAREAALEEAAKVAEASRRYFVSGPDVRQYVVFSATEAAAAIRALSQDKEARE